MANNSQGSKKSIGKIKAKIEIKPKTQAEFEEAQIAAIKGEPLEVSRMMPQAKTGEQKPAKTPSAEGQQGQPPVEEFNPMENEPEKNPQEGEAESPQDEVGEEEAEEKNEEEKSAEDESEEQEQEQKEEEEPKQETEGGEEDGGESENPQKEKAEDEVKQKVQQQIKERAKKFAQNIAKKFSKAGLKAAASAVWAFIVAFWPYILAVLVIIFVIITIASSCSRQGGKTPTQPLDKQRDEKLVLQFLAAASEKSAQKELIAKQAIEAKKELDSINLDEHFAEQNKAEAQKTIDQIKKYLDEIVTLAGNDAAIKERVSQINQLLDKLNGLSGSTQGSTGDLIGQAQAAEDKNPKIATLRTQINAIGKMVDFYQRGHLVVNPKDVDYVRDLQADRRIVQMLVYLVTPQDQGGAGHERIRVKKIRFSYDTERKSLSKETDFSEQDEPNVSAHFTGQAADISEIDCIKCTQIKRRRVGGSSKSTLAPIPINVAWQSEEGYLKAGGPDAFGQNMHQVFNNLGSGAIDDILIEQISDILGVDLEVEKIKGKTFAEISRYVSAAILKKTLDIPGDYELGNNLEDLAGNTGRAYLAQALGVSAEGIQGQSPNELTQNVGRSMLEEKMLLPTGSLEGKNSGEILATVGRRKLEETLKLSRNSLAGSLGNAENFKKNLGQGRVEASLGIKPQTFYGQVGDFKKRVGKDQFSATFANPETIDNWLGIATGSTKNLIESKISADDFARLVGDKVYQKELAIYQSEEKRAEVFGISQADLNSITGGDKNAFVSMGRTTIAKTLTASDEEQGLIVSWLSSGQLPPGLDEDYLAGQYGLREGDLGKIFVDDLGKKVFSRIGQRTLLDNFSANPKISAYLEPVQDFNFYNDRLHLIGDNLDYLADQSSDPQVRAKALETKNLTNDLLNLASINKTRKNVKQMQINTKDMAEKTSDPTAQEKLGEIEKAVNEIIEGQEIPDFNTLSPSGIKAKTDPQVKLTKKDLIKLLTGTKTVDDLIYAIGLRKWEIEFDLPDESLKNALDEMKKNNFSNPDDTLLVSIGKTKVQEYGTVKGRMAQNVDRDLGLPAGTTADYQAGQISENAFYKKVGMVTTNNVTAGLLNKQLELDNDPNYALTGADVTKLLNGGWFYTALKIGGPGLDEALGFPPGGMADIINQTPEAGDIPGLLAEKKLGQISGLDRAVSINGDVSYNLGRVKIEQELWLSPNELNDANAAEKIKGYTGSAEDSLSRLDITFGLAPGESAKLIRGEIAPHEYIVHTGNYLRDSVIYDQLAKTAPALKNQDLKVAVLALAERTGSPQEILEAAGARQVGQVLGLDYPISIRGNFKDNLGQAKIEDRLGLKNTTFRDNIDKAIELNGSDVFESAFYIERGQLAEARRAGSPYWTDDHKNQAALVDAVLNIPAGKTYDFLVGAITLPEYVDKVGQNSLQEVTVDKLADLMGLEDKYTDAAKTLVDVFHSDPALANPQSQRQLFEALTAVGGWNLDNQTKFDPGTWERILFVDPNDTEHTGPKNAGSIILEQGKKWLPRWLGMDEQYDPYMDLIYEQATGIRDEAVMTAAIAQVTGIPDAKDAQRFLNGDIKGGLTAWGAAQLVQGYNKEFGDWGFTLDYATAKQAYFNDPTGEKAIGEAAVASARRQAGGAALDPGDEETIRQDAIRTSRDNARKDLQFRAIDMQLHKQDKNIPAGFTQAMREGTSEQKWQMGLTYVGNMVHSKNPEIPAEVLPDLERYFNSDSADFHNPDALSNSSYAFLDSQMQGWFGDFIQPGTAKALFVYGKTGQLGGPNDQGSLSQIYTDYGTNIIANWADNQLNLPSGTTKMAYDYHTKYQAARKAYDAARIADASEKTVETAKALKDSEAALDSFKAEAITMVVTFAFQKQLSQMDQKLGLVPGSSTMLVGIGIDLLLTGAANPAMVAYFIVTNLFGVYRIDVTCTACGYYPGVGNTSGQSCPLGEFNGKSDDSFKTNAMAAAQWKVNQLINDVLQMPKALNDDNLTPTQIMTFRQDDVDSSTSILDDLYGPATTRMNSGMWANELMWDHVHIGY